MKKNKFLTTVACGIILTGCFASCGSSDKNSEKTENASETVPPEVAEFMEKGTEILTEANSYWERWDYDFMYSIGDKEIRVNLQVISIFDIDGKEHRYKCYYDFWDGEPLVIVESKWDWDLEFDQNLGTTFLTNYFPEEDDDIIITNLNMKPSDFNLFDSEYRLWIYGNAYTNNEEQDEPDEGVIEYYGWELIDLTPKVFVLQNLETRELARYEKKYGKPTFPIYPAADEKEEGD